MRDHSTPRCLIPDPGQCFRKCDKLPDAANQEYTGDCCPTSDPIDATSGLELDTPCVIQYCEDYD
jgi:hypothetical protein